MYFLFLLQYWIIHDGYFFLTWKFSEHLRHFVLAQKCPYTLRFLSDTVISVFLIFYTPSDKVSYIMTNEHSILTKKYITKFLKGMSQNRKRKEKMHVYWVFYIHFYQCKFIKYKKEEYILRGKPENNSCQNTIKRATICSSLW